MKTKTSAALLAMGLGFAGTANATGESGVINFVGSVYTGACTVTIEVDGAGTTNATNLVTLQSVDGASMAAAGAGGTETAFNIALTACTPASIGDVELALTGDFASNADGVVNAVYDNGNNAGKLGFQIKAAGNGSAVPAVIDWRTVTANLYNGTNTAGATHDIPMSVGYYSLDSNAAPGGIVRATVNYLVSYY